MPIGIVKGIIPRARYGLRNGLDDGLHEFPTDALQLRRAFGGYGNWASAWKGDVLSGKLIDSIGTKDLTVLSTPIYNVAGSSQSNRAVRFDNDSSDGFEAADTTSFDLGLSDSIAIYACLKFNGTPSNRFMISKITFGNGYGILAPGANGTLRGYLDGAVNSATVTLAQDYRNAFNDVLFFIDRTDQVMQMVSNLESTVTEDISLITSPTNTVKFSIGAVSGLTTCGWDCTYVAIATSDVNALRLNASTAITNIRKYTGR